MSPEMERYLRALCDVATTGTWCANAVERNDITDAKRLAAELRNHLRLARRLFEAMSEADRKRWNKRIIIDEE